MSELVLITILVVHFIGDYLLQTTRQATTKSYNIGALFEHVSIYSACWLPVGFYFLQSLPLTNVFVIITFVMHFLTDYFTSKAVRYFFSKKDDHHAYVVMGFDQVLHYLQLYFTFKILLSK